MSERLYLHFEDEVISFDTIKKYIEKETLNKEEIKLLGDYLTRKKQMKDKWSKDDEKKFLRAKRLAEKQEQVISEVKEKKKVVA